MAGKVRIVEQGRSGKIQYSEGWLKVNTCEFYWEFGGGNTLLPSGFPPKKSGPRNIPGRRAGGKRSWILSPRKCANKRRNPPASNGKMTVFISCRHRLRRRFDTPCRAVSTPSGRFTIKPVRSLDTVN